MNIRDERVCSTEIIGAALLPNTPPLIVWPNWEQADSKGKRTDVKILTVAVFRTTLLVPQRSH